MKNKSVILFGINMVVMIILCINTTYAQKFKIETKSADVIEDKLVVAYELTDLKKDQRFIVWLEIKNSSGEKLKINAVSGDIGSNILAGNNKKITWDFIQDNIVIDDKIGIEVKAEIMSENLQIANISTGKALLLSAVVPGLGLTKVKHKKYYLLMGAITYGTAAMSYVYNKKSFDNYNTYLSGNEISSESEHYNNSLDQKSMSKTFMYTALSSWAINMVWTYLAASKNSHSSAGLSGIQKMRVGTGINYYSKTPVITLNYNF